MQRTQANSLHGMGGGAGTHVHVRVAGNTIIWWELQRVSNMELGLTIFGGTEGIIDYLRRHNLLCS